MCASVDGERFPVCLAICIFLFFLVCFFSFVFFHFRDIFHVLVLVLTCFVCPVFSCLVLSLGVSEFEISGKGSANFIVHAPGVCFPLPMYVSLCFSSYT